MGNLKPGSNTLWESSRMILPEHRERLVQLQYTRQVKTRPDLDHQQIEGIHYALQESLQNKTEIRLQLYGDINDQFIEGYAVRINNRRVLIQKSDGDAWVSLHDIISAEII